LLVFSKILTLAGIYIPGSRNIEEILSGAAKNYAFKDTLLLVLIDMKEAVKSCTGEQICKKGTIKNQKRLECTKDFFSLAGNQVNECAEVIAQSLQKCDDKYIHKLSLSILQQIVGMRCTDEKIQLPSDLKFRLFETLPNSLGLFSSVAILKKVCQCTRYILELATDVEKVSFCYVPAVEKIILEASSLLSIAKPHDYLGEVWKCLVSVTAISNAGCRAFVSSKGLNFLYESVKKISDDVDDMLVDITGIHMKTK